MIIFLSYARADSKSALKLAADLREFGIHVWIDQINIAPGQPWDSIVQAKLSEAEVVVVLLSLAAVASTNVLDEVAFALDSRKRIVPILLEQCPKPLRLARTQHIAIDADIRLIAGAIAGKAIQGEPDAPSARKPKFQFEKQADHKVLDRLRLPGLLVLLGALTGLGALSYLRVPDSPLTRSAATSASAAASSVASSPLLPPLASPSTPTGVQTATPVATSALATSLNVAAASAYQPAASQATQRPPNFAAPPPARPNPSLRFVGLWDYDGPAHGGNWVRALNANGGFFYYGGEYPWIVDGASISLVHQSWREDGQLQGEVIRGKGRFTGDQKERFGMPAEWTWTMRRHDPNVKEPTPPVEVAILETSCLVLADGGTEVTLRGNATFPVGALLQAKTKNGQRPKSVTCGAWETSNQEHHGESVIQCRRRADQSASSQWAAVFRDDDEFDSARRSLSIVVRGIEVIPTLLSRKRAVIEIDAKCP